MRSNETTVIQYCLDAVPVAGFVATIPDGVEIVSIRWRAIRHSPRIKPVIPDSLKARGLMAVQVEASCIDVQGLAMKKSPDYIKETVAMVSKKYGIPPEKFMVQYVILGTNKGQATFKRMYKQIRLPEDKRRKKIVLGLTSHTGEFADLMSKLSAKKISCRLARQERTIVMCSEEVV